MHAKQILTAGTLLLAACSPGGTTAPSQPLDAAAAVSTGGRVIRRAMPADDPGPPFYARAATVMNEIFRVDGWVVIPFYRQPDCVPAEFNLLQLYHAPGPDGPGAFACPLLVTGAFLIEEDAPLGALPRQVTMQGGAVPFWLVRETGFDAAAADGTLTMAELRALNPLAGTAKHFHETLMPRMDDHKIVIEAQGTLEDGRSFRFSVVHIMDQTKSIQLRIH